MSVFTRPDSKHYWLYLEGAGPHGRGKKERTTIRVDAPTTMQRKDNRQLAEQWYHQRMTQLARGVVHPDEKPKIAFDTFATWFAQHTLPHRRGREREAEMLPRLRAAFGPLPLTEIDRHRVTEWTTERLNTPTVVKKTRRTGARTHTVSPTTVNREVDLLKAILQAAVPKYLASSPLYGMPRLATKTPKRRLLSADEEQKLLKVMSPDDKALFLLGLDSLVRLSDILDVTREDRHGRRVWIADPKAGGGFDVPISKRTQKALDAVPDDGSNYYFNRRRHAKTERDRRNVVGKMLKRYCDLASVPYGRSAGGVTFHWATRRTGATRMLVGGVDPGTVQKIGRWKTPDVVLNIYHELIDEHARNAVEIVGGFPVRSRQRKVRRKQAGKAKTS